MADEATAAPVAAAPAAPAAAKVAKFDDFIEVWWKDHFLGSVLGNDTRMWNLAFAAKEDLKQRLDKAFP